MTRDEGMVLATADICPHGTSSSLCEWCEAKATAENRLMLLARKDAEVAELRRELSVAEEVSLDFCKERDEARAQLEAAMPVVEAARCVGAQQEYYKHPHTFWINANELKRTLVALDAAKEKEQ